MSKIISLVPDRLAHYRVPVFQKIAEGLNGFRLVVYADLRQDSSLIKKPSPDEARSLAFSWRSSHDFRVNGRLLLSSGSIKSVFDASQVVIVWGDAFCPGNWLSALLIKFFTKKKLAFWTHGLYGNESGLKKKLRCLFYSFSDAMLLYGQNSRNLLIEEGFCSSRLYVINNSLDANNQENLYLKYRNSILSSSQKILRIIFVGRLTKIKRLDLLLQSIKIINNSRPLVLDIVGEGDQLANLESVCNELGVREFVNFHGGIYDEDRLAKLIMSADMMVSPGNVGLTAMHALIYGTPVVSHSNLANQMPEVEAIQEGVSGELFREGDPVDLAESILRCDRNLKDKMITEEKCRNILKYYYSPEYQFEVFERFLNEGVGIYES